jgi:putative transposase
LKRFPVQDDEPFLLVCRYVERNALRAGLVGRAEDGTWGSLNRWLQEPERKRRLLSARPIAGSPRWAERVNKPLTFGGTQNRSHQSQPGRFLGRWEWGAGHLAAPEPPVDPPPTRKIQKRVLTPFPLIDKPILGLLRVTPDTPSEITSDGTGLVLTPVRDADEEKKFQ